MKIVVFHRLLLASLLFVPLVAIAQTRRFVVGEAMKVLDQSASKMFLKGELPNPQAAKTVLQKTLREGGDKIQEFALIHVLKWSDPDASKKQTVESEKWYVFRDERIEDWSHEDFAERNHIPGRKQILFLYVYLNLAKRPAPPPVYDIRIKRRLSTNLQNLLAAAGLFTSVRGTDVTLEAATNDYWAGGQLDVAYVPSDIVFTPKVPGAEGLEAKTFDNEGPLHWDISIGVPLRRISQTTVDTAANALSPKDLDKHNLFALINLYLPGRDLKRSSFSLAPYPVAGVAIAKQPLHKILLGAGWGPAYANLYVGALWARQPIVVAGAAAGTPLGYEHRAQLAFGLNITIRALQSRLQ